MKVGAKTPSIESLRLLHTLCQTENLAAAAERLGLSLPTASRMLSQLREIFEDRLFTRFPGGLVPTRKAKLLMTRTEAVLKTYDALLAPQTFDPARIVRDIRIGCADNAPFSVFPNFARELLAQAPGVMISYLPLSDDRFSLLSSGEIDFAVSPVMTLPAGFHAIELAETDYVLTGRRIIRLHVKLKRTLCPLPMSSGTPLPMSATTPVRAPPGRRSGRTFFRHGPKAAPP